MLQCDESGARAAFLLVLSGCERCKCRFACLARAVVEPFAPACAYRTVQTCISDHGLRLSLCTHTKHILSYSLVDGIVKQPFCHRHRIVSRETMRWCVSRRAFEAVAVLIFARRRAVFVFWFGLSLLRPVLALYSPRFILALLSLSSILSFFRRECAKYSCSGHMHERNHRVFVRFACIRSALHRISPGHRKQCRMALLKQLCLPTPNRNILRIGSDFSTT